MSTPSRDSGGTSHLLPLERKRATFDIESLKGLLSGRKLGDKYLDLFKGPPFDSEGEDYYRSYEDLYLAKMSRFIEAVRIARTNPKFRLLHMSGKIRMGQMFETAHMGIHFSMFLTYLQTQTTPAQKKAWLTKAKAAKYFGAYAQTELGHGSNVRGLETTATYDPETEEFVIHSPTLTSLKWWPTAMYACTHGVVFARLIVGGKDHGFHGFMMQFRDDKGCCLPGVEIGEIGPKVNGTHPNIGYARFTYVRVPLFNLFSKYSKVTKDGKYIKAPKKLSKFKYISMMGIRVALVSVSYQSLARAATIVIRYSCVRHQGFKQTKAANAIDLGENVIMDYRMQQYRTYKALALAYTLYWNARYIRDYLGRVQSAIVAGDDSAADELPELHATCAGLKVISTVWAHANIEECRKACGGQGFLLSSGIAEQSRSFAEPVTVEGEQVILSLQVARFLIKAVRSVKGGRAVVGSVTYLTEKNLVDGLPSGSLDGTPAQLEHLLGMLKSRASRMAYRLEAAFDAATQRGCAFDEALNSVAILAYKVAECHTVYNMCRYSYQAVLDYVKDKDISAALLHLFELLVLIIVREQAGDWIDSLNSKQLDQVYARINVLLSLIRPNAVGLVDGFNFSDKILKSTLGRYDGNVYEAIYKQARTNPLNQGSQMKGWDEYKTILDLDFLRDGLTKQRSKM